MGERDAAVDGAVRAGGRGREDAHGPSIGRADGAPEHGAFGHGEPGRGGSGRGGPAHGGPGESGRGQGGPGDGALGAGPLGGHALPDHDGLGDVGHHHGGPARQYRAGADRPEDAEPPKRDGEPGHEDEVAQAKVALRRLLAARRGGTGPRSAAGTGLGPGGPWPGTGPRATLPAEVEITRRVVALPELATARIVAAFVSLPGEPNTRPLLDALRSRGVRVLLPVVREDLDLDFREYAGTLVPGALGTREPPPAAPAVGLAAADAVLIPAVAVDPRGHRLGRGGGSYDRALRRIRPGTPLVAVVDDHAIVDEVPVAAHDLSVSVIVTPTRVVRCR